MHRVLLFLIVFSFALSACAAQPTATLVPTAMPTNDSVIEDPAPSATTSEATQEVQAAEPSSAVTTFQIIPGESQVTYEVGETFFSQGNVFNLAVGITDQISGDVTIDYTNPQNSTIGTITIDISQFTSDSNRRDNAIRDRFLESSKYPQATFTPTKIEALPSTGEEGVDYSLKVTGDLKVKETTKEVTFDVTVRLEGDNLTGTATTTILMSDFGVGPISIGGILETQDEAKLTLTFVARPAQ
jgi:polyisoprenoid-binding protein YceI